MSITARSLTDSLLQALVTQVPVLTITVTALDVATTVLTNINQASTNAIEAHLLETIVAITRLHCLEVKRSIKYITDQLAEFKALFSSA